MTYHRVHPCDGRCDQLGTRRNRMVCEYKSKHSWNPIRILADTRVQHICNSRTRGSFYVIPKFMQLLCGTKDVN
jgi:hypothetical protein